jgi:hypothetical protein
MTRTQHYPPQGRYRFAMLPWTLVDYNSWGQQPYISVCITFAEMNKIDMREVDAVTWPHDHLALLYVLRLRQNEHAWDQLIEGELF